MAGNENSGRKGKAEKQAMDVAQAQTWTKRCPRGMPKKAKEYWHEIVPILQERNVLDDLDLGAMEQLCHDYAMWHDCMDAIEKYGQFYEGTSDRGAMRVLSNPAVARSHQLEASMDRLRQKFGLTPKDREHIKAHGKRKGKSIRDQYA